MNSKKRDDITEKKILFADRFEITPSRLLGKGSFGEIYVAQDIEDNYSYCALKIENRTKNFFLKIEKSVLDLTDNLEGFPKMITFNTQNENNYLAMELLGPNLADLFEICHRRFTKQTTLLIAIQILTRIQDLHSKNYLHRDIKPENFLIGVGEKSNTIYIIDFGLSKKYKDAKMDHLPYREHLPLIGTTRYASVNNHLGIEQSRRDDLEAIGYLIIYFLRRRLPWQGCQGSTKQAKYNKILEKKLFVSIDQLCKDLPIEFSIYMNYVKNLRFDERPNYEFLKGLFTDLLFSLYIEDFNYDWTLKNPEDPRNIRIDKKFIGKEQYEKGEKSQDGSIGKVIATDNKKDNSISEGMHNVSSSESSKTEEEAMDNFDGDEYLDMLQTAYGGNKVTTSDKFQNSSSVAFMSSKE